MRCKRKQDMAYIFHYLLYYFVDLNVFIPFGWDRIIAYMDQSTILLLIVFFPLFFLKKVLLQHIILTYYWIMNKFTHKKLEQLTLNTRCTASTGLGGRIPPLIHYFLLSTLSWRHWNIWYRKWWSTLWPSCSSWCRSSGWWWWCCFLVHSLERRSRRWSPLSWPFSLNSKTESKSPHG